MRTFFGYDDIINGEILAAGPPHANDRPRVLDGRRRDRNPHHPNPRGARYRDFWFVAIHDHAGAMEPVGIANAAREVPLTFDTIAAVNRPGTPLRSQRSRHSEVRWVTAHLARDTRREPAHEKGQNGRNHRAPTD